MQETNLTISTSISESFDLLIFEALWCGKIVVSELNSGLNDFLTNQNYICTPIKQPKRIQNDILRISSSFNSYYTLSLSQGIVQKYGRKAFRERMDEIYKQILKKS
jgi:hypothetical protein